MENIQQQSSSLEVPLQQDGQEQSHNSLLDIQWDQEKGLLQTKKAFL